MIDKEKDHLTLINQITVTIRTAQYHFRDAIDYRGNSITHSILASNANDSN